LLFVALLTPGAVAAEEPGPAGDPAASQPEAKPKAKDRGRFGPYLGVNALYAVNLFESGLSDSLGALGNGLTVKNSPGLNARLGLRLFSWLALEAQYEWVHAFEVDLPAAAPAGVDITSHTGTLNAKIFIPIAMIHPYLLGGVGYNYYEYTGTGNAAGIADGTQDGFAGRLGCGVDLYITRSLLVNAEVTALLTTNDLDFNAGSLSGIHYLSVSAGLQYRF
jgi:outer membrane protein W